MVINERKADTEPHAEFHSSDLAIVLWHCNKSLTYFPLLQYIDTKYVITRLKSHIVLDYKVSQILFKIKCYIHQQR